MQTYRNGSTPVYPNAGRRRRRFLCGSLLVFAAGAGHGANDGTEPAADWSAARSVAGVALESRPTATGFDEVRGQVTVCTSVATLTDFVRDPERFPEWIPFTEDAHAVPDPGAESYYLRTATPWPMRSRDLVYHVVRHPVAADGTLRIDLRGDPDALPPRDDAVRMAGASGVWTLRPGSRGVDLALQMTVDPGRVPALFANRRLAATVGQMLANLRERYSCP
ncbi:MAG: SRPBCC family protein [Pseudomonadales bacterium]